MASQFRNDLHEAAAERVDKMYEEYQTGLTLAEVGRRNGGISKQRVAELFKEHNKPRRPRSYRKPE